jgi:hypothetical protein
MKPGVILSACFLEVMNLSNVYISTLAVMWEVVDRRKKLQFIRSWA